MTQKTPLIFDFGNVIAFFNYAKATATLGQRLGISGDELLLRLQQRGFNSLVVRYESGRIDDFQVHREFNDLAELDMTYDEFVPAWSDIFHLNESVAALIEPLKAAGHTLVLGSNTNALHSRRFLEQFDSTLRHFDGLVLSYQVGHVKPSREFYLTCAARAGRPPEECVFIDDLAENIAGAKAAGLQGIVYRDTPKLLADLHAIGVRLDDRPV